MLKSGILNPHLLSLLARVRHTNTLVIADRGFPSWPNIETIDLSLVDNIPTVLDILLAIRQSFVIGHAWMAAEFKQNNTAEVLSRFSQALSGIPITYEPHLEFKHRIPSATGLIRTADTILYANLLLESA